eukprot:366415-Chlamydomonas_euryale.AAC.17
MKVWAVGGLHVGVGCTCIGSVRLQYPRDVDCVGAAPGMRRSQTLTRLSLWLLLETSPARRVDQAARAKATARRRSRPHCLSCRASRQAPWRCRSLSFEHVTGLRLWRARASHIVIVCYLQYGLCASPFALKT